VPQCFGYGGFQVQDFAPNDFLCASIEARISSIYDVNCVEGLLETLESISVIVLLILLALLLFVLLILLALLLFVLLILLALLL